MRRNITLPIVPLLLILPVFAQSHKQKQRDQEILKEAQTAEESSGGNAAAELVLGDSYEHGRGTPQDYAEALRWYLKSANRGYPAAQAAVAWLYFGHGPENCSAEEIQSLTDLPATLTPQDVDKMKARLDFCMSGPESNMEEAYFWVDVALASDLPLKEGGLSKDTREKALILRKMAEGGVVHGPQGDTQVTGFLSQEKIAATQARATKWFAEHQQ